MERTNTRFKHQSEQFWVAEKTTKGGGALNLLLILCWLAGANDELYFWKFIPNYNVGNFDPWVFWDFYIISFVP